jgi:hypothetical protein
MAAISKDFLVKHGLVVSTTATFLSTVNAVSTTTGALQVDGGAGIQKNLYVGGNLNVAGNTNLAGITAGPTGAFPISLSSDGTATYYTGTTAGGLIYTDGSAQFTRAPIAWTNELFLSEAAYYLNIPTSTYAVNFQTTYGYQGDPNDANDILSMAALLFPPTVLGGLVAVGDTYFDDGVFGSIPNHIYIMVDQSNGLVQFFDITPTIV